MPSALKRLDAAHGPDGSCGMMPTWTGIAAIGICVCLGIGVTHRPSLATCVGSIG